MEKQIAAYLKAAKAAEKAAEALLAEQETVGITSILLLTKQAIAYAEAVRIRYRAVVAADSTGEP